MGEQHLAALEERKSRALGRKQKVQPVHQEITRCLAPLQAGETKEGT